MNGKVMMRGGRAIRTIVLACAGLFALSACGLFVSEDTLLKRAQEQQKRGELRSASISLKSLLEKHPTNREARLTLGLVDLESGDYVAAARELERARTDGIASDRIIDPLARAYQGQRELDKALQLLDGELAGLREASEPKAIENRAHYTRLRGELLFVKHQYADARVAFESALKDAPNDTRAMLGLAGVVESTEGAAAAIKETDRALAVAPNDVAVHMVRGALFLQLRKANETIESFQKAADGATAPNQKNELLNSLGGLTQGQLLAGQVEPALKTTDKMLALAPNSPVTRYARAYALTQNGDLDKARELLELNVAQTDDLRSKLLLGAVNLTQGRYAQAETQLSSVVAAAPSNPEARQLLAEARLKQSKPADALDTLLPAIERDSNVSANMVALAGQASLAAGKTKEGVALLKRNADQHPQDMRMQLDLAAGYVAAGQSDQALAVLNGPAEKVAEKGGAQNGRDAEMQVVRREYLTVVAQVQKGDAAGAAAHAIKAAQDQPKNAALQGLASAILMTQRQYAKARPFAEAAVRLQPDQASSYSNLGRLDLVTNNIDAARKNFQTALDKQPGDTLASTALALIELSSRRYDQALQILDTARKHNAKSIEPRLLETQILLTIGKLDEAEKLARETVAIDNDNASTLAALGRVLSMQNRHAEALQTFERAVRVEPKNVPIRFQLAVANRVSGRIDDALKATRDVLAIDAHYAPAVQLDGLLSIAKGDLATAGKRTDELLKTAQDQPGTHELAAVLRAAQKRYPEAATEFQKANELSPRAQYAIGEFQVRMQGKLPEPEAPLEKFLAKNPDDPTVLITLAQAQQARGDRASAGRSYEAVLSKQPKNVVALNNLAWMHFEDGKPDATELAQRAYNAAPKALPITDTYAWILVNTGKTGEGLKLFESFFTAGDKKAVEESTPEIRAHYAVALARSGRQSEAKTMARELTAKNAADLSPDVKALLDQLIKS